MKTPFALVLLLLTALAGCAPNPDARVAELEQRLAALEARAEQARTASLDVNDSRSKQIKLLTEYCEMNSRDLDTQRKGQTDLHSYLDSVHKLTLAVAANVTNVVVREVSERLTRERLATRR